MVRAAQKETSEETPIGQRSKKRMLLISKLLQALKDAPIGQSSTKGCSHLSEKHKRESYDQELISLRISV